VAIEIDEEGFAVESEEPEFDHLDESAVYNVQIKVFGVGGGGGNAVENMAKKGLRDKNAKDVSADDVDIEFVVVLLCQAIQEVPFFSFQTQLLL